MSSIQDLLIQHLKLSTCDPLDGSSTGGCISHASGYLTDRGPMFVKSNQKLGADVMFTGEHRGLMEIQKTDTIKVPAPLGVIANPNGGALLVTEYLQMNGRSGKNVQTRLGTELARLHMHNWDRLKCGADGAVSQFGFHVPTCCGFIAQDNTWNDDWIEFFTECRLQRQVDQLLQKGSSGSLSSTWCRLKPLIPRLFADCQPIKPSLLHGDLWSGNYSFDGDQPVVFDCAAFYGHNEYEFGIVQMFGGFSRAFYDAYFSLIPKVRGFEDRATLYELFHQLNHWNHFGGGYRSASLSIMEQLIATCEKIQPE